MTEIELKNEAVNIRSDRDRLLRSTDWTQLTDVPSPLKDKYTNYRQALRDIPQQEGFPLTVSWPSLPE